MQDSSLFLQPEEYSRYFEKAVSWSQYLANFENEIALGESIPFHQYLPQNWQRTNRVYKTTHLLPEISDALSNLKSPLKWLIISENWCGDASQIVPVLVRIAESANGKIDLRLIYRDQNSSLMDAHLTNGTSRSIPILVQLNANFQVQTVWGPRPAEAQSRVMELKNTPGADYIQEIHTWYARDKQKSIQTEILPILAKDNPNS